MASRSCVVELIVVSTVLLTLLASKTTSALPEVIRIGEFSLSIYLFSLLSFKSG